MAKALAWLLFLFSSALFIGNLAMQQTFQDYQEMSSRVSEPLPDMVRFQQACHATEDAATAATSDDCSAADAD